MSYIKFKKEGFSTKLRDRSVLIINSKPQAIKCVNQVIADKLKMANKFNASFQSEKEPDYKSCLKFTYTSFNENIRCKLDDENIFTFESTNEDEIEKLIKELNIKIFLLKYKFHFYFNTWNWK